jgi:hypothetical protein
MKKFLFIIFIFLSIILSNKTYANNDFEHRVDINYFIENNNTAVVDYSFETTNKINNNYLKNFKLQFPYKPEAIDVGNSSTQIRVGNIEKINDANFHSLTIDFLQPNYGINKKFYWSFKFKINEFLIDHAMQNVIALPTFSQESNEDQQIKDYSISVNLNKKYNKPTYIYSEYEFSETPEYYIYKFKQDKITTSSITMLLGEEQDYSFGVKNIKGNIFLPEDNASQKIYYNEFPERKISKSNLINNNIELKENESISGIIKTNDNYDRNYHEKEEYILTPSDFAKEISKTIYIDTGLSNEAKAKVLYRNLYKKFTASKYLPGVDDKIVFGDKKDNEGKIFLNPAEIIQIYRELLSIYNIKSRGVYGYVFALQPFKRINFQTEIHIWTEIWNGEFWIPSDPLWQDSSKGTDYFDQLSYHHIKFGNFYDYSQVADFISQQGLINLIPLSKSVPISDDLNIKINYEKEAYLNKEVVVTLTNNSKRPYLIKELNINSDKRKVSSTTNINDIILYPNTFTNLILTIDYDLIFFEEDIKCDLLLYLDNNNTVEEKTHNLNITIRSNISTYFSLFVIVILGVFIATSFLLITIYKPKFQ